MVGDRVVSSAAVTHGGGGCADDGERWEWRDLTVGPIIFFSKNCCMDCQAYATQDQKHSELSFGGVK